MRVENATENVKLKTYRQTMVYHFFPLFLPSYFVLFHFSTKMCTLLSSLETNAIEL